MPTLQEWLEDPTAVRGIFVIATATIDDVNTELYLSSVGYMLADSVTSFDPIINTGVKFTESITVDGGTSLSYGDIEISNFNGDYDHWLDSTHYVWVNRPIKIYVGDPRWVATDLTDFKDNVFFKIFDGVIADIDSRSREMLNLKLRDKMERLNTTIYADTFGERGTWEGGTFPNKDEVMPLIFGEVHNMSPTLTDPATLTYMASGTTVEQIIEIRDNGVPIYTSSSTGVAGATPIAGGASISGGSFSLTKPPVGTITASIQGFPGSVNLTNGDSAGYVNNIAAIIAKIVTQFGTEPLSPTTDLDLTNFNAFATANPQPIGILISGKENVISVCQSLAGSIGAQLHMTRFGLLQLLRLGQYTSDTPVTITDADILHHSLSLSGRVEIKAAASNTAVKNWTVQADLTTGIPAYHKTMFAEENTKSSYVDTAVSTKYRVSTEATPTDSFLVRKVDAEAEAERIVTYFKTPRTVYRFIGTSRLMSLNLGQQVTLVHNRFGLYMAGAGKTGQVISLSPDWLKATIEVEVII